MATHLALLIIPLALTVQSPGGSISEQAQRALSCGRVIAVSCASPSGPVTLLIATPGTGSTWRVLIPAQQRYLFGSRIENRYEDQRVCVDPATWAAAPTEQATVREPSQLVVADTAPESRGLPDGVYRTCDADVQSPVLVRSIHAQMTAEAMRAEVHGSVVLRGVVDSNGAVTDVRVVQSLEPSLDLASRDAFGQWTFRPARRGAEPIPIAITVEMTFTMRP